jgi:hypothetical protein
MRFQVWDKNVLSLRPICFLVRELLPFPIEILLWQQSCESDKPRWNWQTRWHSEETQLSWFQWNWYLVICSWKKRRNLTTASKSARSLLLVCRIRLSQFINKLHADKFNRSRCIHGNDNGILG